MKQPEIVGLHMGPNMLKPAHGFLLGPILVGSKLPFQGKSATAPCVANQTTLAEISGQTSVLETPAIETMIDYQAILGGELPTAS